MACVGPVLYRRATTEDAAGIARVHVEGWHRAHEGVAPPAYAASPAALGREAFWREQLELEAPDRKPWVAIDANGIIGFADGGMARDDDLDIATGEVYTLFVAPECWAKGIRSKLVEHVARDLRAHGFVRGVFWVLEADDVMRSFADHIGWRPDGATRQEERAGVPLMEMRYARDLY